MAGKKNQEDGFEEQLVNMKENDPVAKLNKNQFRIHTTWEKEPFKKKYKFKKSTKEKSAFNNSKSGSWADTYLFNVDIRTN